MLRPKYQGKTDHVTKPALLKGDELLGLKRQVLEHFSESNWRELGALTGTLDRITSHPRLLRSLRFADDDYEELVILFLSEIGNASTQDYGQLVNYIHSVCGVPGENVSRVNSADDRVVVFHPGVFSLPDVKVDPRLIAVMMPFEEGLSSVYSTIKAAAATTGYQCRRADDIWDHATVIQDIFALIFESSVVVCDFTGKNPNVFYEAGIAHTLGKHVVPITQQKSDIPFDLQHHRHGLYLNNEEGRAMLGDKLRDRLKTLARQTELDAT